MKTSVEKTMLAGAFLLLIGIGVIVFVSIRQAQRIQDTANMVDRTQGLIYYAQRVLSLALENETLARGYSLTGNSEFLETLATTKKNISTEFEQLKTLTADIAFLHRHIDSLQYYINKRIEFSDKLIFLRQSVGLQATTERIATGQGKYYTERIGNIIEEIVKASNQQLQQRRLENEAANHQLFKKFWFILAIIFVLLSLLALKIRSDMVTRKRIEEQNRYSSLLLKNISDAVISTDKDLCIRSWNKAAEEMYGYSQEEAWGKNLPLLLKLNLGEEDRNNAKEKLHKQGYHKNEFEFSTKDDSAIFVLASVNVLHNEEGEINGYVALHRDITERKRLEEQLKDFNRHLEEQVQEKTTEIKDIFERVSDAFIALDGDWNFTYVNSKAGQILNRTPASLIGKHIWTELPEAIGQPFQHAYDKAMKEQQYAYVEEYYPPYERWFENHIYPSNKGLSIFFRDITEKKLAEQALKNSEETRRLIMNSTLDAIIYIDSGGTILEWNPQAEKTFGWKKEEVIGKTLSETIIPHQYRAQHERGLIEAAKTGEGPLLNRLTEITALTRQGKEFPIELSVIPVRQGEILFFCGFLRDISKRKKAEHALAESEHRLRTIIETEPECIKLLNEKGELQEMNPAGLAMVEAENLEQVKGQPMLPIVNPEYRVAFASLTRKVFKGIPGNLEYKITGLKGTQRWLETYAEPLRNAEGKIISLLGVTRDITDRKKVEDALSEERNLLRTLIDNLPDYIYVKDTQFRHLINNKANVELIGALSEQETIGKTVFDYFEPEMASLYLEDDKKLLQTGKPILNREESVVTETGEQRWLLTTKVPLYDKEKKLIGLVGISRDITKRKKMEEALRQSEENYRTLVEQAADAIFIFDESGRFVAVNNVSSSLLGYSKAEIIKMSLTDILFEEELKENPILYGQLRKGMPIISRRTFRRKDGRLVPVEVHSKKLQDGRYLGMVRDLTERIKAEEQIKQTSEQLRELSARLQDIREEERINIAREIHDELGQRLTVLKMDISWLGRKMKTEDTLVNEKLKETMTLLDGTIKTVRKISTELRPSLLDDLGLTAAMEWQSKEFENRSGIKVKFESNISELELPSPLTTGLFRIYQEALTNVGRHAEALQVTATLQLERALLKLTIGDNGKGFDAITIANKKTLGLLGMKERTMMMGGEYDIKSVLGEGTMVTVTVPLADSARSIQ